MRRTWRALGVAPYAYGFDVTHHAAEVLGLRRRGDAGAGRARPVAGRLMALRGHGKAGLRAPARRQRQHPALLPRRSAGRARSGATSCSTSATGSASRAPLFRTRTGEITVRVDALELLAKSMRPLPDEVARAARPGDALPPALRRPVHEPRGARDVPAPRASGRRDARVPRRARLPRGRDAGAAAALRRRVRAPVRDPPQRARHGPLPAHLERALPQAPDRRAGSSASTSSRATSATRAWTARTTPSSPCSSSTRRSRTCTT